MFIAGRVFEKSEDARIWVELNTAPDERRYWYIVQLLDEDLKFKIENRPVAGLPVNGTIHARAPDMEAPADEVPADADSSPEFEVCAVCAAKPSPELCPSCVNNRKLIGELQAQVLGFNTQLLVATEKLEKQAVQLRGDAVTEEKVARAFARLPAKETE